MIAEFLADLIYFLISFMFPISIVAYGVKAIITKKITLRSKFISRSEVHTGESAVIWGGIFILLGVFLFWVFMFEPTIQQLGVDAILKPLIEFADTVNR